MSERSKAILEQIFDNETARVLDHLSTFRPFDYAFDELSTILSIPIERLSKITRHLESYGLIQTSKNDNWQLAENEKTKALNKLLYEIMMDFIDYHSRNTESRHGFGDEN